MFSLLPLIALAAKKVAPPPPPPSMLKKICDLVLFKGENGALFFYICLAGFCAGNCKAMLKAKPAIRYAHGLVLGVLTSYGGSTLACIICGRAVVFQVNEALVL